MDERTRTITQKRFLRGSQRFTIDGHTLKVEHRRGWSLEQQCFDLDSLQPEPLRIRRVPLGRMLFSLVGVVLTAVLLAAAVRTTNNNAFAIATLFGFVSAFSTLIVVIQTCLGFANVVAFQGSLRQIRLWHELPDKATFNEFVEALSERIRAARTDIYSGLHQLRLAHIIDDRQYHLAMELFQRKSEHPGL